MVCPWFNWIALPVVPFRWFSVLIPSTLTFDVFAIVEMCGCTTLARLYNGHLGAICMIWKSCVKSHMKSYEKSYMKSYMHCSKCGLVVI